MAEGGVGEGGGGTGGNAVVVRWLRGVGEGWYDNRMRRGQTLVEYVLVLVLLLGAASAAGFMVRAVRAQAARTETLLGSDYP